MVEAVVKVVPSSREGGTGDRQGENASYILVVDGIGGEIHVSMRDTQVSEQCWLIRVVAFSLRVVQMSPSCCH